MKELVYWYCFPYGSPNGEVKDAKSDMGKSEFKTEKRFSGVTLEQGKVLLGGDVNEETKGSIIVVADTHFGLYTKSESCDPNAFTDFLSWIRELEKDGEKKVKLGVWGSAEGDKTLFLTPPEKMVLLGDILELWTSSNEAVFASTISTIELLSELKCQKIYVLGNHDYDLYSSLMQEAWSKMRYPLGASKITIFEKEYWTSKTDERYCFLHGQQFDKLFTLESWKFMAPLRKAASAFGSYTWILAFLCMANFIFQMIVGVWGVTEIALTLLLSLVSTPYLVMLFSRKVWNHLKTIKFNPKSVKEEYEEKQRKLWKMFSGKLKEKGDILNVVYGHTHTIDSWRKEEAVEIGEGEKKLTQMEVANVPSWIINSSNEKLSIENEISHVFLYITERENYFIGWDFEDEKPYLIPKDLVEEKRKSGSLIKFEKTYNGVLVNKENLKQKLSEIDWPDLLIEKWMTGFKID